MFQQLRREVVVLPVINNPQPNQPLALYLAILHSTISLVLIVMEGRSNN